jgi:hypothetical protein
MARQKYKLLLCERQVLHLALRQTEGFMNSVVRLMILSKAQGPGNLVVVDSSKLKVYHKDECHKEKHGVPARRTWRKLHLVVDENHQILACELTMLEVGYPTAVPDLLTQVVVPPTKRRSSHRQATPSKTSIFKPLQRMVGSPGKVKIDYSCAVESRWGCAWRRQA